LREFWDTPGDYDRASVEMHLEAVIQVSLEEYLEAISLEEVGREGGVTGAETLVIG